jgi:hypothetical protein
VSIKPWSGFCDVRVRGLDLRDVDGDEFFVGEIERARSRIAQ